MGSLDMMADEELNIYWTFFFEYKLNIYYVMTKIQRNFDSKNKNETKTELSLYKIKYFFCTK